MSSRRSPILLGALAAWMMVALAASAALGQHRAAPAEETLQQAVSHFLDGSFANSRALLRTAMRQTRRPHLLARIHLYLALNDEAENDRRGAVAAFRRALRLDPRLELDRDRIKPATVELFLAVRRQEVGQLSVDAAAGTPEVWVDDRRRGRTPLSLPLARGPHRVEIRGADGETLSRTEVEITADQTFHLDATPSTARSGDEARRGGTRGATPDAPRPRRSPRRVWTWVAGGGALAAMIVAIAVGSSAKSDHGTACDMLAERTLPCEERQQLLEPDREGEFNKLRDAVGSKALTTNVAWAMTGVLTAGAILLYWLEGRRPSRREGKPARVRLTGQGLAVQLDY